MDRLQIESHINELKALVKNVSFYFEHDSQIYQGDIDGIKLLVDRLDKIAIKDTRWLEQK